MGGGEVVVSLSGPTLLIFVKTNCDGCRAFLVASLDDFVRVDVVIVANIDDDEWADSPRPVFVSPGTFAHLDVRSPPFYVLIDPERRTVLSEGVVFGRAQVAAEIAPLLAG